jgi:hypothetical protein
VPCSRIAFERAIARRLSTTWWRQFQQDTSSDRTPSLRMLPSVIGSTGWSKRGIGLF